MAIRKRIIFVTSCQHKLLMPYMTPIGYIRSCPACQKPAKITDIQVSEWHAFCTHSKCPFSAWTGLSKMLANQAAKRHAKNAANHAASVQVEYMPNPVAVARRKELKENHIL